MAIGPIATLIAPREPSDVVVPKTLRDAVVLPFADLLARPGRARTTTIVFLSLVIFYKLGDAFGSSLFTVFLQRGLGFQPDEVATFRKTIGVGAVLGGMIVGGFLMVRMRLGTALLVFGILQALTNLVFVAQAEAGKDFVWLVIALGAENIASGLGAAAFITFITILCDPRFSAFQYALLSAVAMVGSILIGPIAGPTAEAIGWPSYFIVSTFVAVPGLVLLVLLRRPITALDRVDGPAPSGDEARG